jgi:hypothetical protein
VQRRIIDGARSPGRPTVEARTWQGMRQWSTRRVERTGDTVDTWNQRVAEQGFGDEAATRAWLSGSGVTGYAQPMRVWERFGYPEDMTAGAEELIGCHYADRP